MILVTISYIFHLGLLEPSTEVADKKLVSGNTTTKQTYSEEKLEAVAKAFALSDICTARTGKIPATEISNAMRMLGQCPTQLEVNQVIIDVELLRRSKEAAAAAAELEDKKKKRKKKRSGRRKYDNVSRYHALSV